MKNTETNTIKEIKIGRTIFVIEEQFAEQGKTLQEVIENIIVHKAKQVA